MATIPEFNKNERWVINGTLKQRYRRQFFSRVQQKYDTGIEEYTDLTGCVASQLQLQAGQHVKNMAEAAWQNSVTKNYPQ